MKIGLVLATLIVSSCYSLPIERSWNEVGRLDVLDKKAETIINKDETSDYSNTRTSIDSQIFIKREDANQHKSRGFPPVMILVIVGGVCGIIAILIESDEERDKKAAEDQPALPMVNLNETPDATVQGSDQLEEDEASDTEASEIETSKAEGRNMAFYKRHYGSSEQELNQLAINLTGLSPCRCIVSFPLRTVAILKVLFQENHFFSPGEFGTIGAEYLAFIKDKTNALKMIDRYSSCEKFIDYFDNANLEREETTQSIISTFNNECIICRDEFKTMDAVCVLPWCGHYFHSVCCQQWLTRSYGNCPVCFKYAFTISESETRRKDTVQRVLESYNAVDEIEREFWEHVKVLKEGVDDITNSADG